MDTAKKDWLGRAVHGSRATRTSIWGGYGGWGVLTAIGLFLTLTPHLTPGWIRLYDLKRLLQVALLILLVTVPLVSPGARRSWLGTASHLWVPVRIGAAAFLSVGVVSALFSADRLHAFLEVTHFCLLAASLVSLAALYKSRPQSVARALSVIVFAAVTLYVAAFLRDYLFSQLGLAYSFRQHPGALWPWGEFLGFAHTRYFNQFQTWTLPLVVLPLITTRTTRVARTLLFAVPAIWWMLLFASGGRGTLLSIAIAAILILALSARDTMRYLLFLAATAVAGTVLYLVFFQLLGVTSASLAERELTSSMGRLGFWRHAFDLLRSSPLIGVGPGQYAWFHHQYAAHPHNSIIQIVSEWGALGGLIVIGLVTAGVGKVLSVLRGGGGSDIVFCAVTTSLLAGLCHSLLSGVIVTPVSQLMLVVISGWLWGMIPVSDQALRHDKLDRRMQQTMILFIPIFLVVILVEIGLTSLSYYRMEMRREETVHSGHRELPRFWVYGCPRSHADEYPLMPPAPSDAEHGSLR